MRRVGIRRVLIGVQCPLWLTDRICRPLSGRKDFAPVYFARPRTQRSLHLIGGTIKCTHGGRNRRVSKTGEGSVERCGARSIHRLDCRQSRCRRRYSGRGRGTQGALGPCGKRQARRREGDLIPPYRRRDCVAGDGLCQGCASQREAQGHQAR
jgi:hypothetical protein